MTTPETDVEWGIIWRVATLPEDGSVPPAPEKPARPELPLPTYDPETGNPIPPQLTPEQQAIQDQYIADLQAYDAAVAARDEIIDQVLENEDNWHSALTVLPDEAQARQALKMLKEANLGNKYTKDFELATAPSRIWTVTP